MCDQAGGLQYGYHWLNLAVGTARCVRSGLHCRALIKVFITITATNDSNPFQVYRGDDEKPPEGRLSICSYQYGLINRFLGITSFASVQVAVVTLHAWFFFFSFRCASCTDACVVVQIIHPQGQDFSRDTLGNPLGHWLLKTPSKCVGLFCFSASLMLASIHGTRRTTLIISLCDRNNTAQSSLEHTHFWRHPMFVFDNQLNFDAGSQ